MSLLMPPKTEPRVRSRCGLLRELDRPSQLFAYLTPNWYASIMGTGIVAVAAAGLPIQWHGLLGFAELVWVAAATLLIALTAATTVHWRQHPSVARSHLTHPVMGHFYGAPAMALMTVGAATLLVGRHLIGMPSALVLDWVLWSVGTVAGLSAAVLVPYRMFPRRPVRVDGAFGGWLMPIVPPMVSASTGALLVAHLPAGRGRLGLLLGCYTMFGLSLAGSAVVIALLVRRLARHPAGPSALVPTVWIVLGPLGQSVTAANLLGGAAVGVLPRADASALHTFGIAFSLPVLGLAALWAVLAAMITVRTARDGLPFSLAWWSFTFPVGTCVTGVSGLALRTGSRAAADAAVLLYLCLLAAWAMVTIRTVRASASGRLFLPPPATGATG